MDETNNPQDGVTPNQEVPQNPMQNEQPEAVDPSPATDSPVVAESPDPATPAPMADAQSPEMATPQPNANSPIVKYIIAVVIVVVLVGGGWYVYANYLTKKPVTATATTTTTAPAATTDTTGTTATTTKTDTTATDTTSKTDTTDTTATDTTSKTDTTGATATDTTSKTDTTGATATDTTSKTDTTGATATDTKTTPSAPKIPSDTKKDTTASSEALVAKKTGVTKKVEIATNCNSFPDKLSTCSVYKCKFTHPFTGESMQKEILGIVGGKCKYVEQMPAGGKMECNYVESSRKEVAKYYKNVAKAETTGTSLSLGEEEKITYTINGKKVDNPLQELINDKTCVTSGY